MYENIKNMKRQFNTVCHDTIHKSITSGNVICCLVSNVPKRNRRNFHIHFVQVIGICIEGYVDSCGKVWKYASIPN